MAKQHHSKKQKRDKGGKFSKSGSMAMGTRPRGKKPNRSPYKSNA